MSSSNIAEQPRELGELSEIFTNDMFVAFNDAYSSVASEDGTISRAQLSLLLESFGMTTTSEVELMLSMKVKNERLNIDAFFTALTLIVESPHWAMHEMTESYMIFDNKNNGYLDPIELKRVFAKIGEVLTENDFVSQINEFDIDGDHRMQLSEWFDMCTSTKGRDFKFDD